MIVNDRVTYKSNKRLFVLIDYNIIRHDNYFSFIDDRPVSDFG